MVALKVTRGRINTAKVAAAGGGVTPVLLDAGSDGGRQGCGFERRRAGAVTNPGTGPNVIRHVSRRLQVPADK